MFRQLKDHAKAKALQGRVCCENWDCEISKFWWPVALRLGKFEMYFKAWVMPKLCLNEAYIGL